VVESGATESVLSNPAQPYTKRLLAAASYSTVEEAEDLAR
jgi:microcin C transport system ATP-binding protein